ncbi:MAG: hypothetical protein KAI02_02120 [Gammaproteobacteria bacterium]|nr:hypothetical protein [Gammaproteobacteria bacterium]
MKLYLLFFTTVLLISCSSSQPPSQRYNGNFRYFSGIAEFFDCKTQEKHYVTEEGIYDELIASYKDLNLKPKDDVYIRAEGFYQEEEQMEGVDPLEVFVVTKIIEFDTTRSCKRPYRQGL